MKPIIKSIGDAIASAFRQLIDSKISEAGAVGESVWRGGSAKPVRKCNIFW
jgi:hypothetical protein